MAPTRKTVKKPGSKRTAPSQRQSRPAARSRDPRAALKIYVRLARSLEQMGKRALASGDREDLKFLVESLTEFRKESEWLPKMVASNADARKMVAKAFADGFRLDEKAKA